MSFFEISTAFVKTYSAKIKDILKQLKEKILQQASNIK